MRSSVKIVCPLLAVLLFMTGCSWPGKNVNSGKPANETPSPYRQQVADVPKEPLADAGTRNEDTGAQRQKTAYITMDDGPSRNNTTANLNTLKKYGIKATFFVVPQNNVDDVYRRILDEGHVIGNHSYSHDYQYLYSGSTDNFAKDVLKAKEFMHKNFNYRTTVFRFPGGSKGRKKGIVEQRAAILAENGYRYYDWDVSTADTDPNLAKYGDEAHVVDLLVNNVVNGTKGKNQLIVLMHDDVTKTYTAKALPRIIEGLKEQGYRFDVLTNYR